MTDTDDVLARDCPACGDVYAAHSLEGLAECVETMDGDVRIPCGEVDKTGGDEW